MVDYLGIRNRMLEAGNCKNDSALARALGVKPQALSNYKKRGKMPTNLIFRFAERFDVSLDWLVASPFANSELKRIDNLVDLSLDEMIVVGKAVEVMRGGNAKSFTLTVDSFYAWIKSKAA